VALGADESRVEPETSAAEAETRVVDRHSPVPAVAVRRRVKDAIRRRTVDR
jgi:hypothetical protein